MTAWPVVARRSLLVVWRNGVLSFWEMSVWDVLGISYTDLSVIVMEM